MIDVVFLAIGIIIMLGFFSLAFFEKTKIPDILLLMLTGVVINQGFHFIDTGFFVTAAPYVGALALIILLFEGGINLKFYRVLKELPMATGFTVAVFILSAALVSLVTYYFFNWNLLTGLLLGCIISGTSSAIVISLVSRLKLADCIKIILTLESTLTDALCIISALAIVGIITAGYADVQGITNGLFGAFSIASVVALIFGLVWIKILSRFHDLPFGYLLTIGVLFILYGLVEYSKGNGAIAAFVFGLILGNSVEIGKILRINGSFIFTERIKSFHEEVSFFIRTFFFVYLGMLFTPTILVGSTITIAVVILIILTFARFIPTYYVMLKSKEMTGSGTLIATMMPRGLASAVLATDPTVTRVVGSGFTEVVILIIIFTNIIATVGVLIYEKRRKSGEKELEGIREGVCPVNEEKKTE